MADEQTADAISRFDLQPGLLEFYSSQAQLMLAQYDNINRLLGPTTDHSHPGAFCEMLLRDFLRRFVPPSLSVDCGFFYGRTDIDGTDSHCPEIDILIHDSSEHKPLFRMGDFVIVKPLAVRGIIQVKKKFTTGQVARGIRNVVKSKVHLAKVFQDTAGLPSQPPVFGAVVGFEDDLSDNTSVYKETLLTAYRSRHAHGFPTLIGSLRNRFLLRASSQNYRVYESNHAGNNVFAEVLISSFFYEMYYSSEIRTYHMPPFSFPSNMTPIADFSVPQVTKAVFDTSIGQSDGHNLVLLVERSDGTSDWFVRQPDREGFQPHFEADTAGNLVMLELLKHHPATTELFVKRGDTTERYMPLAHKRQVSQ